jgi:hypothetical protein
VQATTALSLPAPSPDRTGTVEIEFATGGRMRITGLVDASTVSALMSGRPRLEVALPPIKRMPPNMTAPWNLGAGIRV